MKIVIITVGSRGDAQPCVAIGLRLQKEGYDVVIGAPPNHQKFVNSFGIKFASVGIDTDDFIQKMFTGKFSDPASEMFRMNNAQNQDAWKLCQEERPDFILAHQGIEALLPIAKKLNVQCAEICFAPWDPTGEFQNYFGPSGNGTEIANYINNIQIHEASWLTKPKYLQSTLESMQVSPLPTTCYWKYKRACHVPILYAFSPTVIRPKEWNEPDYYITGYWPLHQPNWTPSAELVSFIADPPLYIGFGSMYQADPQSFFDTIVKALETTGQRAVVAGYNKYYKEELKSKECVFRFCINLLDFHD